MVAVPLLSDTFTLTHLPLAHRAEAYCQSGFVIGSQSTLFGDTYQDLRDVLADRAAPLNSLQQGGVCAFLEVCSLHSQHCQKIVSFSSRHSWSPVKASLTTSVPAAVSCSRQTQSHAWGELFLKTTFSTDDVPKYTGPNQRQDSGTPCKKSASPHENHLEGRSNKDGQQL